MKQNLLPRFEKPQLNAGKNCLRALYNYTKFILFDLPSAFIKNKNKTCHFWKHLFQN